MDFTRFQTLKEKFNLPENLDGFLTGNLDIVKSLCMIAVITVLSYEVTDLFYKIISIPLIRQETSFLSVKSPATAMTTTQSRPASDYAVITERNLFRSTLKPVAIHQGDQLDASLEQAEFDLKGTVAGNTSFNYIIVEERLSKKQKLYKLGDKIGTRELIKIGRNTATFKENGREITLKVKATIEGDLFTHASPTANRAADSMTLSREAIREQLNDLKTIMNQAVIRPFLREGVQEGFIISNIVPDSIYAKMGLQNGDIIIAANNKPLQNAGNLLQVVNSLQSGKSISLNVKRAGKMETIHYSFQ